MTNKWVVIGAGGITGMSAVYLTGTEGWTAFGISFATGLVTAATFDVVRRCLEWWHRNERDVTFLLAGKCPRCTTHAALEVTSDDESLSADGFRVKTTELECQRCGAHIRIGGSEGGPIVTRLNF